MSRPNILILYTDQQRWDAIGSNGNDEILTPNLDGLARESVNYNHCFVQHPLCMPSRISFLSGQYPSRLGITHMGVPVPQHTQTLPRILGLSGYTTANIGKLHFLPHANRDHRALHPSYGFDHLEVSDEPGCYEDAYRAWVKTKDPSQLDHISIGLPPAGKVWRDHVRTDEHIQHPGQRFVRKAQRFRAASDLTHTAFVAERTMDFLEKHRDESFVCIAGFYAPHAPWIAPLQFLEMYDPSKLSVHDYPDALNRKRKQGYFCDQELRSVKHGYYAMISELDHHVGRIMTRIEELGLKDHTMVIFTSDHGEWLGEHLRYGKGYPGHDAVSRVPLLIRDPRARHAGRTIDAIVEAVDVLPTILSMAGIPIPPHLQGRPLYPFDPSGADKPPCAIMECTDGKVIRTEHFRYAMGRDGEELLYDLDKDPRGYVSVAADPSYRDALHAHRGMLLHRLIEIEKPLAKTWPY